MHDESGRGEKDGERGRRERIKTSKQRIILRHRREND